MSRGISSHSGLKELLPQKVLSPCSPSPIRLLRSSGYTTDKPSEIQSLNSITMGPHSPATYSLLDHLVKKETVVFVGLPVRGWTQAAYRQIPITFNDSAKDSTSLHTPPSVTITRSRMRRVTKLCFCVTCFLDASIPSRPIARSLPSHHMDTTVCTDKKVPNWIIPNLWCTIHRQSCHDTLLSTGGSWMKLCMLY